MPEKLLFEDFLLTVDPAHQGFVMRLHEELCEICDVKLQSAKSGYVVSYNTKSDKHALMNFIMRKKGVMARVYATNIAEYTDFLSTFPEEITKIIAKASDCKRLKDPTKCSSRCAMGYDFALNGDHLQKCRYGLMFLIEDGSSDRIRELVMREAECRAS